MRNFYCILCALCLMFVNATAQNISRIEYFFNSDPGFGQATTISGFASSDNITGFQSIINLSSVPFGVNRLYIRAKDGNGNWSFTNVIPFVKVDVSIHDIVRAEYFLNTDPGIGKATPITLPVYDNVNRQSLSINIESALLGINTLYIRTEDNKGNWSLTNCFPFIKGKTEGMVTALEYFIDADPGPGMGTPVELVPAQYISNYIFNADVSSVAANTTHNLFIRAKDAAGDWCLTNILSFTKMSGVGVAEFQDASEAFKVFPNPAKDKVTIQCLPGKKMDKIELINTHGELIKVYSFVSNTDKQIDISNLSEGTYFIKISVGKDVVYKKVVKE